MWKGFFPQFDRKHSINNFAAIGLTKEDADRILAQMSQNDVPVEKDVLVKSIEWGSLFYPAARGEQSEEILTWQKTNRELTSTVLQDFVKGFEGPNSQDINYVINGIAEAAIELGHVAIDQFEQLTGGNFVRTDIGDLNGSIAGLGEVDANYQ